MTAYKSAAKEIMMTQAINVMRDLLKSGKLCQYYINEYDDLTHFEECEACKTLEKADEFIEPYLN